jgi:hypothetical protein
MNIYSVQQMNKYSKQEVIDMPGYDRTGPWGYGPMTGRGMGPCGRGSRTGAARGSGRGMGRGFARYGPYSPVPAYEPTREQEIADLRAEKELVEKELEEIKSRMKELEKEK